MWTILDLRVQGIEKFTIFVINQSVTSKTEIS